MWCPCFVMYNHKQLVIMKKVLLALFALLALASCSKEANEPKGKESAGATTPIHVDVSGDVPTAKALDFSYQNGRIKAAFLEGKTEIPVWTCVYRNNDNKIIYFERVNWKVDGTKIYYKGDLPITASEIRTGGSWAYTLVAIIGGEKDPADNRALKYSFMQDHKIKALSTTEKFSMDIPYRMIVKLTLEQQNGRAKEFQNFTQPAADKKFKPMGCFFMFKVTNKADQAITINAVKSTYLLQNEARLFAGPIGGLLSEYRYHSSADENKTHDVVDYEFEDGALTLQPGASSAKTYYFWLPSVPRANGYGYGPGPFPEFAFSPVRLDLALAEATTPRTKASYTATFLTQPEASYKSGSFYTGELTFRTLDNPLDRLSKSPLDETGTAFVDNSIGFDATFNKVGYFTEAQVRRDFSEARTYTGGGSDQWYVPNSMEWQSIFPRELGFSGSSSDSRLNEQVQVEGFQFQSIAYFKRKDINSLANIYDVYALRFCPWDEAFRGKVMQSGASGYLTTNQMRYAFRYRFQTPSRKLIVEAKYVGDDSSIQSVEDIQDISLGGKIDWSTVTASYTFPMYGGKLPPRESWPTTDPFLFGDSPQKLVSAHATPIRDTMGHFLFGTGVYAFTATIRTNTLAPISLADEQRLSKPIYLFKKMN